VVVQKDAVCGLLGARCVVYVNKTVNTCTIQGTLVVLWSYADNWY